MLICNLITIIKPVVSKIGSFYSFWTNNTFEQGCVETTSSCYLSAKIPVVVTLHVFFHVAMWLLNKLRRLN
uniref:Uncharacterized protein n=1 Tax=Oncorhynchus mykiss TaxID=8022 RepID=A0A8K9UQF4_ONCMY